MTSDAEIIEAMARAICKANSINPDARHVHGGVMWERYTGHAHASYRVARQRILEKAAGKVTRFEVIDDKGRSYSKWGVSVELSYQDDGRTLKAFVRSPDAGRE